MRRLWWALPLALAGAVLLALVVGHVPAGAQTSPSYAVGQATVTTDANGYVTVPHTLGVVPVYVGVSVKSPTGGPDCCAVLLGATDYTSTAFTVRFGWYNSSLGAYANKTLTVAWAVSVNPSPPSTTTTSTSSTVPAPAVSDRLVPAAGAWWGYHGSTSGGIQVVYNREADVGRHFDAIHDYEDMSGTFPNQAWKDAVAAGRFYYVNVAPRVFGGNWFCWADVAGGSQDAWLTSEAQYLATWNQPLWVSFTSEPDASANGSACTNPNTGSLGTAADYRAAYRHVHDVMAPLAPKIVWVANYVNPTSASGKLDAYDPGGDVVDWYSWDPYNWGNCNGFTNSWTEWGDMVRPATEKLYDWAARVHPGKPLMLAEYGSQELSGHSKGDWFRAIPAAAASQAPNIRAVFYFDSVFGNCTTVKVDSSADSLGGFTAAGHDAYFNQPHG